MTYTISQVAKRFSIEPHTLRYYEKEGLVEPHRKQNGIRFYSAEDVSQLEMAMCLKSTGMPLKDIKRYFELVAMGDDTLDERLEIFTDRRDHVLAEIETLKKHLAKIEGKIAWYGKYVQDRKAQLDGAEGQCS